MEPNSPLIEYLWSMALRLPVLLVAVGGILWAILGWRKASTGALFTVLACVLLLATSFIFPALFTWVAPMLMRNAPPGEEFNQIRMINRTILGAWNLCTAVCFGALIIAVFAGRAAQARSDHERRNAGMEGNLEGESAPPRRDEHFKAL